MQKELNKIRILLQQENIKLVMIKIYKNFKIGNLKYK